MVNKHIRPKFAYPTSSYRMTPIEMAVEEESTFQRIVVGPLKFLIFIFSLAMLAKKDDCAIQRGRARVAKNRLTIKSRTPKGEEDHMPMLNHFQKRIGSMEIKDAFDTEEYLTTMLSKVLMGLVMVGMVLYMKPLQVIQGLYV